MRVATGVYRVVPCELGPDAANHAAAEDGQADLLSLWSHVFVVDTAERFDPVQKICDTSDGAATG